MSGSWAVSCTAVVTAACNGGGVDESSLQFEFAVKDEAAAQVEAMLKSPIYKVRRFAIRTARIAGGLLLGVAALYSIGSGPNVQDVPFASLTLGMVASSIFGWLFGLFLGYWAFVAAFGASPDKEELVRGQLDKAAAAVRERLQRARMNT